MIWHGPSIWSTGVFNTTGSCWMPLGSPMLRVVRLIQIQAFPLWRLPAWWSVRSFCLRLVWWSIMSWKSLLQSVSENMERFGLLAVKESKFIVLFLLNCSFSAAWAFPSACCQVCYLQREFWLLLQAFSIPICSWRIPPQNCITQLVVQVYQMEDFSL